MKDFRIKIETLLCNYTIIFCLYLLFSYSFLFKIESIVHVKISCLWSVWYDFSWIKHHRSTICSVFLFFAGTRFDIRDFHSLILTNGAVPMSVLEMLVNEWIEKVKTRPILSGGSFVTGYYNWQVFSHIFLFIILKWLCI